MSGALLAAALDYAARGWPVFPVHSLRGDARCTCGDGACKSIAKHPRTEHGRNDATTDPATLARWWNAYPTANVGIATGKESGLYVLDVDPRHGGDKTLAALEARHGKLPRTIESATGGGGKHFFFKHPGKPVPSVPDVAPGLDVRCDGGYVVAPPSLHKSGELYRWIWAPDDIEIAVAPAWLVGLKKARHTSSAPNARGDAIREGNRNDTLTRMAGAMRRASFTRPSIEAALSIENAARCSPPLDTQEVARIAASIARYAPAPEFAPWPAPLGDAAFHGIAGEFVRLVRPSTEADDAALLVQFLTAAGSCIGRAPYFLVENDRHYPNLYCVLVGVSSKSRKGTSLGRVRQAFELVDADWNGQHVVSGASSGEGVIWHVRDPIKSKQPLRDRKSGAVTSYEDVITDHGVSDKRLLFVEAEFASVLRMIERDGNTLSPVLRSAWDKGDLQTVVKNSPARATDAHISIIGHITRAELQRYLGRTESANGFGNRFLWPLTRRSKLLPDGGCVDDGEFRHFAERLAEAVAKAKGIARVLRDADASALWNQVYERLSEGRSGLVGDVTSRAEAQVLRLSLLYAVLDGTDRIRRCHLAAGLEVWRYCDDSARHIFGDAIGDPLADKLLDALRASDNGLDREEIRELVGNRTPAARIERALGLLLDAGLAFPSMLKGAGRPSERWHAREGNGAKGSNAPPSRPDDPHSSDSSTGEQP